MLIPIRGFGLVLLSIILMSMVMPSIAETMSSNINMSSLSDDQLLSKFQENFDTMNSLSAMIDYTPIVDSTNRTITLLTQDVTNSAIDSDMRKSLVTVLDQTKPEIGLAAVSVLSANVTGINQSLNATDTLLETFAHEVKNAKGTKISSALDDKLVNETQQIIDNSKKRGVYVLTLIVGLPDSDLTLSSRLMKSLDEKLAESQAIGPELEKRGFKLEPTTAFKNGQLVPAIQITKGYIFYVPNWFKNNAKWWSSGQIDDTEFLNEIQYLIQQGIIKVPSQSGNGTSSLEQIPHGLKIIAASWANGQSSDNEFLTGVVEYLEKNDLIKT